MGEPDMEVIKLFLCSTQLKFINLMCWLMCITQLIIDEYALSWSDKYYRNISTCIKFMDHTNFGSHKLLNMERGMDRQTPCIKVMECIIVYGQTEAWIQGWWHYPSILTGVNQPIFNELWTTFAPIWCLENYFNNFYLLFTPYWLKVPGLEEEKTIHVLRGVIWKSVEKCY